jgi:hypothetical protein
MKLGLILALLILLVSCQGLKVSGKDRLLKLHCMVIGEHWMAESKIEELRKKGFPPCHCVGTRAQGKSECQ